jgi:hypothetical protein
MLPPMAVRETLYSQMLPRMIDQCQNAGDQPRVVNPNSMRFFAGSARLRQSHFDIWYAEGRIEHDIAFCR